jgi:hypothetical protein
MYFFNITYPLRCLRVPQVEYHWIKPLSQWETKPGVIGPEKGWFREGQETFLRMWWAGDGQVRERAMASGRVWRNKSGHQEKRVCKDLRGPVENPDPLSCW